MVGQFKDDRIQDHVHSLPKTANFGSGTDGITNTGVTQRVSDFFTNTTDINQNYLHARKGDTTRGKSKGVKYLIKAL